MRAITLRTPFLLCFLAFSASPSLAQTTTETIVIQDYECGDTCVLTVQRGKRSNEYYMCAPKDMRPGSKVPVCLEIFGTGGNHRPNVLDRTVTLDLKKVAGSDTNFWIVGGRLHPVAGTSGATTNTGKQAANQQQKQGNGWDSWLEATGNKTKVAAPIASSSIRTTGSPPAPIETVVKACQHLVNYTGPGKPGIGSIFSIEYLSPVDASTVYGNMGPQGKLFPLKLHALYRDGEKYYANGYIQKDAFGEFKCIAAR